MAPFFWEPWLDESEHVVHCRDRSRKQDPRVGERATGSRSGLLFDASNEFVQSDVVPGYGHAIVDATVMEFENEFDVILCTSVLEHVYDHRTALERIHRALKPGGKAVISVPFLFPYHDEPQDFWRFTEYGLRRLLEDFSAVDVKHRGYKRLPFSLFVTATK